MTNAIIAQLLASLLLVAQSVQKQPGRSHLMEMVESERAFARTSAEEGIRASFMEYFDDSAIVFRPHPVYYKEVMKNVPAPQNPHETTLTWEPIVADIAQSGDFGYTSGPSVWTDHSPAKRPPYYGFYFSIWKKSLGQGWKVAFDVGTEMPGPYTGSREFRAPTASRRTSTSPGMSSADEHRDLMNAERKFLEASLRNGAASALDAFMDEGTRVYREKHEPLVGKNTIRPYFVGAPYLSTWKAINSDVASSGDLGYVYGSYEVRASGNGVDERGYYLRVWKRDARNQWKIAAEVLSALPQEAPAAKK